MNVLVGALLVISTFFDGRPLPCVVDTGSPVSLLTRSAAQEVQHALRPLDQQATLGGISASATIGQWHVARHVGTRWLGWEEALVLVVPDGVLAGYRCVLGTNLLGQQPLLLDWRAGEVRPGALPYSQEEDS